MKQHVKNFEDYIKESYLEDTFDNDMNNNDAKFEFIADKIQEGETEDIDWTLCYNKNLTPKDLISISELVRSGEIQGFIYNTEDNKTTKKAWFLDLKK